jgi:hypothetical protein
MTLFYKKVIKKGHFQNGSANHPRNRSKAYAGENKALYLGQKKESKAIFKNPAKKKAGFLK